MGHKEKADKLSFVCNTESVRGLSEDRIPEPRCFYTDEDGNHRTQYCMACLVAMYERYLKKYGDKYKALYVFCSTNGYYYDDVLAHRVFEEERVYEDGTPVSPLVPVVNLYIRAINDGPNASKQFTDSPSMPFDDIVRIQRNDQSDTGLTEQGRKDRNEIIEKFNSDPFETEPIADRPRLYSDLLTLYDDAMSTDLVKQKAAIEIIKSFYRIDMIGRTIQELQKDTKSMAANSKTLKELIDQKKKETDMVTSFSKDHGFAERYQMAKSKGSGSLSSIVRDGLENNFDKMAVNKFDIETANAMKQVAEISAQSMLGQIQLGADDYRDMIEQQSLEIRNLRGKLEETQEALRILREKQLKQELLDEYYKDLKKKGIVDSEIINTAMDNASRETFYPKDGESD